MLFRIADYDYWDNVQDSFQAVNEETVTKEIDTDHGRDLAVHTVDSLISHQASTSDINTTTVSSITNTIKNMSQQTNDMVSSLIKGHDLTAVADNHTTDSLLSNHQASTIGLNTTTVSSITNTIKNMSQQTNDMVSSLIKGHDLTAVADNHTTDSLLSNHQDSTIGLNTTKTYDMVSSLIHELTNNVTSMLNERISTNLTGLFQNVTELLIQTRDNSQNGTSGSVLSESISTTTPQPILQANTDDTMEYMVGVMAMLFVTLLFICLRSCCRWVQQKFCDDNSYDVQPDLIDLKHIQINIEDPPQPQIELIIDEPPLPHSNSAQYLLPIPPPPPPPPPQMSDNGVVSMPKNLMAEIQTYRQD